MTNCASGWSRRTYRNAALAAILLLLLACTPEQEQTSPPGVTTAPGDSPSEPGFPVSPADDGTLPVDGEESPSPSPVAPCAQYDPPPSPTNSTVLVFFICPNPDGSTSLTPTTRRINPGDDPMMVAFEQLFNGPTADERDQGFLTATVLGTDFSLALDQGMLTVDLKLDRSATEHLLAFEEEQQQIRLTGGQFPEVQETRITVNGKTLCEADEECSEGES